MALNDGKPAKKIEKDIVWHYTTLDTLVSLAESCVTHEQIETVTRAVNMYENNFTMPKNWLEVVANEFTERVKQIYNSLEHASKKVPVN